MKIYLNHKFKEAPWGGGNQFLTALVKELRKRGVEITDNIEDSYDLAFINSWVLYKCEEYKIKGCESHIWMEDVEKIQERGIPIVHRKTNAIGRGDWGRIYDLCQIEMDRYVDFSIFQSQYSVEEFISFGYSNNNYEIIYNGVDPTIFNANGKRYWNGKDKLKLVISTWSNNIKKGFNYYKEFDEILDKKQDFTIDLVGRLPDGWQFKNIKTYPPVDSMRLAQRLREYHCLLQFAQDDTCSNAVLEAINCGLPIIYLDSGGTKEIAERYGVEYNGDLLDSIERLKANYFSIVKKLENNPFKINYVADRYLAVFHKVLKDRCYV